MNKSKIGLIVMALLFVVTAISIVSCDVPSYILSVVSTEGGSVSGGGNYKSGSHVTIIAIPDECYAFDGWYEGNTKLSENTEYSFPMFEHDTTLEAKFIYIVYSSGLGTEGNPYIIKNKEQLYYLSELVNTYLNYSQNKYFALNNDIDFENTTLTAIGNRKAADWSRYYYAFNGNFDGKGYKIYNLKIAAINPSDQYDPMYFGVFGYVSSLATIKNLGVTNYDFAIDNTNLKQIYAGGLVGYNFGNIENSYTADSTIEILRPSESSSVSIGGLIGANEGSIVNCYSTSNVSASTYSYVAYAGGLAGGNSGNISYCYAAGNVYAYTQKNYAYAGGLVAHNSNRDSSIQSCYALGNVSATSINYSAHIGGLIGRSTPYDSNPVSYCYRYINQVLSPTATNTMGSTCTLEQLNNPNFYSLYNSCWDLSDLDFENGKYPKLKWQTL